MARRREDGRGERVLPGLWRLRLPLPYPGIPHVNAWAIAAGHGIVLVDTGMHEADSFNELERALHQVGLRIDQIRLLVCTHAHPDHWGQAGPIIDRTGCEFWMHPRLEHDGADAPDREAWLDLRLEIARQSGVAPSAMSELAERIRGTPSGVARAIEPDRELLPGVDVGTDLGVWSVHETPGHAPSHVCLFQAERRLLISGDHLLGRISPFFDYGYTPDPLAEFLASLHRVDVLDARLALSGHGKPFFDVHGHIEGNRRLIAERVAATETALSGEPQTALQLAPAIYGEPIGEHNARWLLTQTLSYLAYLEHRGRARRDPTPDAELWRQP